MATLSQYMLSSAATFSFFLAIGSVCVLRHHFLRVSDLDPGYQKRLSDYDPTTSPSTAITTCLCRPSHAFKIPGRPAYESALGTGEEAPATILQLMPFLPHLTSPHLTSGIYTHLAVPTVIIMVINPKTVI